MPNSSQLVHVTRVTVLDEADRHTIVTAQALYDYNGSNADELPFSEGDQLSIIDKSDADWWKAEQGGMVFIVPAAYLALADG